MNLKYASWAAFLLLCLIWGSSFILMKVSSQGLTAPQIAGVRIFAAGFVFIPFAVYYFRLVPRRKLGFVVLTGVFGNLLPAFLFAFAVTKIDSSLTGILNSLTPVCVIVIGALFFRLKIPAQKVLGVLVGLAGLVMLTLLREGVDLENLGYASLVILATFSYGLNVNIVAKYLKGVNPIHGASVSLAAMTVPAGVVLYLQDFQGLAFSDPVVRWAIVNAVLLGIAASSIATTLFYFLVQRAGGLFASLVTYGVPFVALGWGYWSGEAITLVEIVCLLVILSGVYLANRPVKRP
ncbi:MAG: DMT family transporter [Chitinophagaceae bacterium]|nr:MAG: DMT family transporter [Chitinophagaceae bacterium]